MYVVVLKFPNIHWYNLNKLLYKGIFFS